MRHFEQPISAEEESLPKQTTIRVLMEDYQYLRQYRRWGQPMYDVLHRILMEHKSFDIPRRPKEKPEG